MKWLRLKWKKGHPQTAYFLASMQGGAKGSRGNLTIKNCLFEGNSNGGIGFRAYLLAVTNSSFRGNSSASGGASVQLSNSAGTAAFTNCLFSGNQSTNRASAVSVFFEQVDFINCTSSVDASDDDGTIVIDAGDVRF